MDERADRERGLNRADDKGPMNLSERKKPSRSASSMFAVVISLQCKESLRENR